MSEQVSTALIKLLEKTNSIETDFYKVSASIFIKKCEKIIQEKIAYLYNLLQLEAKNYAQKDDDNYKATEDIISLYKEKLDSIYEEFYLQYINVQNEIGNAEINQRVNLINYQKIINDSEVNKKNYDSLKKKIKNKYNLNEEIAQKCQEQFEICMIDFEQVMNTNFNIEANLPVVNDNLLQKIKTKISNLLNGNKKYMEALKRYENNVNNINTEEIINETREKTVDFVAEILEMKDEILEENKVE